MLKKLWSRRQTLVVGAGSLASSWGAHASDVWPSKQLTIVSPYPPGGITDLLCRIVADELSRALGQAVVVENRTGASGFVLAGGLLSALAFVLNYRGVIVLVIISSYCLFVHLLTPSNSPIRTAGWMPLFCWRCHKVYQTLLKFKGAIIDSIQHCLAILINCCFLDNILAALQRSITIVRSRRLAH